MIYKNARLFAFLVCFVMLLLPSGGQAQFLPIPSTMPKVETSYDSILLKTWQGIKKRNIDPYAVPLVHRPKSEMPGDAVSEGVGYGMLLALYCNDQVYFNKIWDAGEQHMWQGDYYNWRVDVNGGAVGSGAAADAEQDIALALIFADLLVKKGFWQAHTSPKGATYAERAREIIATIWTQLVEDGKYLRPGNQWGGSAFVNPGYFAPAFYRIFSEFETEPRNWQGLIDQCYRSIAASPGYALGLVPDWMKPTGEFAGSQLGYNSYADGEFCYKDAIRIHWRLANDYLWYLEPRARAFLVRAAAFIKTPDRANFFQMDGSTVTGTFELGNEISRPRSEHSHLTTAMWAAAVMGASGPAAAEPFSTELLQFYLPGSDFWGKPIDAAGEDTLHNEMYFDQFLAWFGASMLSGTFANLWEDLNDPRPDLPLAWKSAPVATPYEVNANSVPYTIHGILNKPAPWIIEIASKDSTAATVLFSGKGDTVKATWYGLSSSGSAMQQGAYTVFLNARGLAAPKQFELWLGRALDLKIGNRILIDDFRDSDLKPYIGNQWTSYLDSDEGKAGKSTIRYHRVEPENNTQLMRWAYRLDGSATLGYNPYAALEWDGTTSSGDLDLTGLDTLIVSARSASAVNVSVQLITSDITDWNFFEDSIALTTTMREYALPLNRFQLRWSGGWTLNLSKMRAIRFQVQNVDGTQNEIVLGKLLFSGRLDRLYQSPPPFIQPSVRWTRKTPGFQRPLRYLRISEGIKVVIPDTYRGGSLVLRNAAGRELYRVKTGDGAWITIPFKNGGNALSGSGVYFASLYHSGNPEICQPVIIIR